MASMISCGNCFVASPIASRRWMTESCFSTFASNCSNVMPSTYCNTSRAEARMSSRKAYASRDVKVHHRFQDRFPAARIAALVDPIACEQVDSPREDRLELLLHVDQVKQAPRRVRSEFDDDVDVAVRSEVRPCHAPEERELRHLPLPAEGAELLFRDVDRDHAAVPWHFLYFLPEPQGQGSLRPTFGSRRLTVSCCTPCESLKTRFCFRAFGGGRARCTRSRSTASSPSRSTTTSIFQRYLTTWSWMRSIISWKISNDSFLYSMSGSRWP